MVGITRSKVIRCIFELLLDYTLPWLDNTPLKYLGGSTKRGSLVLIDGHIQEVTASRAVNLEKYRL